MTLDPKTLQQATQLLKQSKRPLLISHPRPDGDTVGCTLALRLALLELGKNPVIACVHPVPQGISYLPGAETYVQTVTEDANIDLVVAIDMSDLKRAGGIYKDDWSGKIPLLVVDHHETNDAFGDVNVVMPDIAATAIPMLKVIEALGVPVNEDIATCLLLAILTDTRSLRTESTTPAILTTVSQLIEAGGDYLGIMQKTLDSIPYQQMRGWGVALERMHLDGEIAWTTFPLEQKRALGIEDHDDMNLGNFLSRIAEAKIVATFLEMNDGMIKVSFRARPGYNIAWIAAALGGGGHRLAAGCSVAGTLDDATQQVLPLVREALSGRQA